MVHGGARIVSYSGSRNCSPAINPTKAGSCVVMTFDLIFSRSDKMLQDMVYKLVPELYKSKHMSYHILLLYKLVTDYNTRLMYTLLPNELIVTLLISFILMVGLPCITFLVYIAFAILTLSMFFVFR